MFRIFYSEQDATLYEGYPDTNTGLDEILEIGKRYGDDGLTTKLSRSVLKFNMNEIRSTLSKYSADIANCKFMLQLFTTDAKNLPTDYTITANLCAQQWNNGTGFLSSSPIMENGITWNHPISGSNWISGSQHIQVSSSYYITGSGLGGSWLYDPSGSFANVTYFDQSFSINNGYQAFHSGSHTNEPTDIYMDVTDAVKLWISGSVSGSIPNNGFLLKLSTSDELNNNVSGYIRYFSRDTHTIYVPRLIMYWDNTTFTTGSLTQLDVDSEYSIYVNHKAEYKDTEVSKIRIYSRDKYPRKSPNNLSPYQTVKYLPSSSFYTVKDAATDEIIIPYDDIYNKISCDATSNYIYLDFNGFMPERYYRLEFKIKSGITEQYITNAVYFKIVR